MICFKKRLIIILIMQDINNNGPAGKDYGNREKD